MNKPSKTQRKTKIRYINKDDTKENIDIMKGYDCFTQTIGWRDPKRRAWWENMLKYIEEAGKFVEITGFRKIGIKDSEEFVEAARAELPQSDRVQFFDAKLVATWQHLFFAVLNALLAFKNELNISKSLAIESMLYASAQRQIRKAIDFLGVKRSSSDIAVVIIGESAESVDELLSIVSNHLGKEPDSEVLEITNEKAEAIRKAFRITRTELETVMEKNSKSALVDLVIERMALLSTQL